MVEVDCKWPHKRSQAGMLLPPLRVAYCIGRLRSFSIFRLHVQRVTLTLPMLDVVAFAFLDSCFPVKQQQQKT